MDPDCVESVHAEHQHLGSSSNPTGKLRDAIHPIATLWVRQDINEFRLSGRTQSISDGVDGVPLVFRSPLSTFNFPLLSVGYGADTKLIQCKILMRPILRQLSASTPWISRTETKPTTY